MRRATRRDLLAPAGLVVGPVLWAATTQAGQILPYVVCGSAWKLPAWLAFAAAFLSLAAGWVSWRAARPETGPRGEHSSYPSSFSFVGRISALVGAIFGYALALQGLSSLILTGCER